MITKVEVQGYRLLHDFQADLGQLTIAIGANATGKSTLQDFLSFLSQAAERPLNAVLGERGGITSVLSAGSEARGLRWRITFSRPRNNPVWSELLSFSEGCTYEYGASLSAGAAYFGAVPESELLLCLPDAASGVEPFPLLDGRGGLSRVFDDELGGCVDFREPVRDTKDLFSGLDLQGNATQPSAPTRPGPDALRQAEVEGPSLLLAQVRYPAKFVTVSLMRSMFASWETYPGFLVNATSLLRRQPADVAPTTRLWSEGWNLATVLNTILSKREYRATAERLKDWLRAAYPEFGDFTVEPVFGAMGKVALRWHDRNLSRDLWPLELSDGILRFLCLATALNDPAPSPLIVIDEPEVGLHPGLLPIVADMLKAAAEQSQLLVTTHSPDLVDCFDLDDVAVMVREDNRARWHRPRSRPTLRTLLEGVEGETLGDLHRTGELEAKA